MAYPPPYDSYYLHQNQQGAEYGGGFNKDINTLFVSGLPDDVKAREIHNLFRRRPGFDFCQLKYTGRGNQVVAFATFVNHQSAMAALHALNGVKFDPQTGSVLHIELARSNSRRKRKPGSGAYVVIDNRTKTSSDAHETSSDGDSEFDEPSGTNEPDSGDKSDLAIAKSGETVVDPENAVASKKETEKVVDGVLPCSTLFIANLGPNCTENELKQVLSQYSGFKVLKVRARGGMPVAFADFEEVEQATTAMDALQASLLPSSDRGGMHIEYARSKMRKS
ncbi:U2 small nuclear ribonucleoprotein B'' [Diospyros lotus]|uniref:U2 small nuclear ribonucleoprotein B'' n=1 Tax=Diospyros lotus TaxID=55363 RepID=UPI002254970F|nr:U2 small nuclear ribonucleoprotein B'' [Diospyros lotus]